MGRLDVWLVSASNLPSGMIAKPDVYATLVSSSGGTPQRSSVQPSTTNPSWDEVFKFIVSDADSEQIIIKFWDKSIAGSDDLLAVYKLGMSGLDAGQVKDTRVLLTQCKTNAEAHMRLLAHEFGSPVAVAAVPQQQRQAMYNDGWQQPAVGTPTYAPPPPPPPPMMMMPMMPAVPMMAPNTAHLTPPTEPLAFVPAPFLGIVPLGADLSSPTHAAWNPLAAAQQQQQQQHQQQQHQQQQEQLGKDDDDDDDDGASFVVSTTSSTTTTPAFSQIVIERNHLKLVSSNALVEIWDTSAGPITKLEPVAVLKAPQLHKHALYTCAISPNNRVLATGDSAGCIVLWDLFLCGENGGKEQQCLLGEMDVGRRPDGVVGMAFSFDGRTLATAAAKEIVLFDVPTMKKRRLGDADDTDETNRKHAVFRHNGDNVRCVTFSPEGTACYLASGGDDNAIRLWNPITGKPLLGPKRSVLHGHRNSVRSIAISPDAKTMCSGSDDFTVIVWDAAQSWAQIGVLRRHQNVVTSVAFSPDDGKSLVSASEDGTMCVWDLTTKKNASENEKCVAEFAGHGAGVSSTRFSPDGDVLVSTAHDGIKLWSVATQKNIETLTRRNGGFARGYGPASAVFSTDGTVVAAVGDDKTARIFRCSGGARLKAKFSCAAPVVGMELSADSTIVTTTDASGAAKAWSFMKAATSEADSNQQQQQQQQIAVVASDETIAAAIRAAAQTTKLARGGTRAVGEADVDGKNSEAAAATAAAATSCANCRRLEAHVEELKKRLVAAGLDASI